MLNSKTLLEDILTLKETLQHSHSARHTALALKKSPIWKKKPLERMLAISLVSAKWDRIPKENLYTARKCHNEISPAKYQIFEPELCYAVAELNYRINHKTPLVDLLMIGAGFAGNLKNYPILWDPKENAEAVVQVLQKLGFQASLDKPNPKERKPKKLSGSILARCPDVLDLEHNQALFVLQSNKKYPAKLKKKASISPFFWFHTENFHVSISVMMNDEHEEALTEKILDDHELIEKVHIKAATQNALAEDLQFLLQLRQIPTREARKRFESSIWENQVSLECSSVPEKNGLFPDISGASANTKIAVWQDREPVLQFHCPEMPDWYPKAHPVPLSVPCGLQDLNPPVPKPVSIPRKILRENLLSETQLEAYCRIRDIHENHDNKNMSRPGFLLGDGTGTGKGRIVAGIAAACWAEGMRKTLWVSATPSLAADAYRDWQAMGGSPNSFYDLSDSENSQKTQYLPDGLLFASYSTLRTRYEEIQQWLHPESLIAFDESQAIGNEKSGQGIIAVQLQERFPRARILYTSSTPFRHSSNLAYTHRLGLWNSPDSSFPDHDYLHVAVQETGLAGMETIQRQLCASGKAVTRSLSVSGIENVPIEIARTQEFEDSYNVWAEAWKIVHLELQKAMQESAGQAAGPVPMNALTAICQSFFSHLLCAAKGPELIKLMEKDIAEGRAPVVQISSTLETFATRHIIKWKEAEGYESGEDIVLPPETDLSMKKDFQKMVFDKFPIYMMNTVTDALGNPRQEVVLDKRGEKVINPRAITFRSKAMEALDAQTVMPSLPDQLIWHFGNRIAEVTGRTKRTEKLADQRLIVRNRSRQQCSEEVQEFLNDQRECLIFSGAGAHGRSYHADRNFPNQKQRVHYVGQTSWAVDDVIQGLGRTHRTNQVSAPRVSVVSTDIPGEQRFFSSTCRKLAELGALTRGDRRAQGNESLKEESNLDNPVGRKTLQNIIGMTSLDKDQMKKYHGTTTNLIPTWKHYVAADMNRLFGKNVHIDPPHINGFLNTLMTWTTTEQDEFMKHFEDEMKETYNDLKATGKLDIGIQPLSTLYSQEMAKLPVKQDFEISILSLTSREYISDSIFSDFSSLDSWLSPVNLKKPRTDTAIHRVWIEPELSSYLMFEVNELPKERNLFLYCVAGAFALDSRKLNADGTISAVLEQEIADIRDQFGHLPDLSMKIIPDERENVNEKISTKHWKGLRSTYQRLHWFWDPASKRNQKYKPGNKDVQMNCLALITGNLLKTWRMCRDSTNILKIQKIAYTDIQGIPQEKTGFIVNLPTAFRIHREFK